MQMSTVVTLICIPTAVSRGSLFPHILTSLIFFLIVIILTGVPWNLKVVFICIFLRAKDVNISLSVSQPFEISLLIILSLDMDPIFKWIIWLVNV